MIAAALLLFVGTGIALVSLIIVHLLPTGLDPLKDPVSRYGIIPYWGWYWAAAGGARSLGSVAPCSSPPRRAASLSGR